MICVGVMKFMIPLRFLHDVNRFFSQYEITVVLDNIISTYRLKSDRILCIAFTVGHFILYAHKRNHKIWGFVIRVELLTYNIWYSDIISNTAKLAAPTPYEFIVLSIRTRKQ